MTGDQIGQLTYLLVLGGALVLWMFIENRSGIGTKLKHLSAWGLIFLGAIAAVGLWGDIRGHVGPARQAVFADAGRVELPRQPDGHYLARLELNGEPVEFVVDTGASAIVLTREDARRAGIDTDALAYFSEAMTANGVVRTALVTLENVSFGPFSDSRVQAFVNSGEMDRSLLGMSYLERFDKLEISGGKLILSR